MNLEQVKEYLPDSIQEIVGLIGYPATVKLVQQLGGITFPFGKGKHALGRERIALLTDCIGTEAAAILLAHYAGEDLYIPRCDAALRKLRNLQFLAEVEALRLAGKSATMALTQLCPKYGFSDRYAWELLSTEQNSNAVQQQTLF